MSMRSTAGVRPLVPPPSVVVVVCAYTERRWDDLARGVAEAEAQVAALIEEGAASGSGSEVLVVIDHNQPLLDRARAELATAARVIANARRQGLSGARNTAVDAARADIVAFLDDDACPRPGWLGALLEPYADPSVLAVGGRAVPAWPSGGRPAHLPATARPEAAGEFDWVVGCTYAGQPQVLRSVRNLMGCNMSFRREVFERVGGFAEDLGRVGTVPLGCEETELCIRARKDRPDGDILFEPAAAVSHRVTPERTTWKYFWSRCRAEGISKAAVATKVTADAALETERGYVARTLPRGLARLISELPRTPGRSARGIVGIIGGTAVTAFGYATGRWHLRGSSPLDGAHSEVLSQVRTVRSA